MITKSEAAETKIVLSHTIKWVFSKQNLDGGLPPYPPEENEKDHKPIVLESGTIASSDFLGVILRPFASKNGKKFLITDYTRSWDKAKVESEENHKTISIKERIVGLTDFLLNVQLSDGGFPPLGDVRWISDVSFTDATAAAVIALISIKRFIGHIYPRTEQKSKDLLISTAIGKGVTWLFEARKYSPDLNMWIWPTSKAGDSSEDKTRAFPIILSAIALNLFSDPYIYPSLRDAAKTINMNEIMESLSIIADYIHNKLKDQRWIGLKIHATSLEDLSFVNTSLAINFLVDYSKTKRMNSNEQIKLYENCFKWLTNKWLEIKRHDSFRYDIDIDRIDLTPLGFERLPPFYDATYARRPSLLFCALTLLEILEGVSRQRIEKFLKSELTTLMEILRSHPYYYEFRGKFTPAISATASIVAFLRKLLEINGYTYTLSNGGE
jgi:hypothetical protein